MENINIKVILDEVFGKSCNTSNSITVIPVNIKKILLNLLLRMDLNLIGLLIVGIV